MKTTTIFILIITAFNINAFSQENTIDVNIVRGDLFSPWELLEAPNGWLWYTEKLGTIWKINPDSGEKKRIGVIDSVYNNFERGLLGMTLHPNFPETPWVYLVYTTNITDDEYYNRLVRMEYQNDTLVNYERFIQTRGNYAHNGSRLKFSPEGHLFMTMGETADHNRAQNIDEWEGKIYRMDENCQPLPSNPFYENESESAKYIYSFGHRNPQGLVFANGNIYSTEHGTDIDDELNIIYEGRNHGWPRVEGFCDTPQEQEFCEVNQVVEPIYAWTPTVAVSGIDFYSGGRFPMFNNSILMTTLKNATLHVLELDEDYKNVISEKTFLSKEYGRLRDVLVTSDDRVFVINSNGDWHQSDENGRNDKIIELIPKSSSIKLNSEFISVYPNPVNDLVNIEIEGFVSKNIILTDIMGNKIYNSFVSDDLIKVNTSNLVKGLYFIQIETTNGKILTNKFVKN